MPVSEVGISNFFGDFVVAHYVLLETVLGEDVFLNQNVRGCLAENSPLVVFWKLPGKGGGHVMFYSILLLRCLGAHVKGYKPDPFAGLCWALLTLVFADNVLALAHFAFFTDYYLA